VKNMITLEKTVSLDTLNALLDKIPLGVLVCDASGVITYANPHLPKDQGYSDPNELLGRNIFDLPSLAKVSSQMRESLAQGKEFVLEGLKYVRQDGGEAYLRLKSFPVLSDGKTMGSLSYVEDITERIRLKEELENGTERLEIMSELGKSLRSTHKLEDVLRIIMIAITAGEGLAFNRIFLLLLNQDETCLEGKMAMGPANQEEAGRIWSYLSQTKPSFRKLLESHDEHFEERDAWVNHLVKKIRIPIQDKENLLVRAMDGQSCEIVNCSVEERTSGKSLCELLGTSSFVAVPLASKGKSIGIILADNLISGKSIEKEKVEFLEVLAYHASAAIESAKLYEKLAHQVAELEKANQHLKEGSERLVRVEKLSVMGEITSQVAHELRNPLTIIGGFANSILKKLDPNDANYEYLKIVSQESQRMENILNNVLNFTRPERAHWENTDLNEIIEQTLDMLGKEMENGKIWIKRDYYTSLPLILVNSDQIRHALVNIFRNAIVAMPQGGTLSIVTHLANGNIKMNIADTGCGIPRERLDSIFKAFYTTKPDSNGLGLTVASEIIKNHNGFIGVESEEGKGTTFYIEFPLKKEE
jgi:PAS domain S-box-containing protein